MRIVFIILIKKVNNLKIHYIFISLCSESMKEGDLVMEIALIRGS